MRSSFAIATLLSAAAYSVNAADFPVMVGSGGTLTFTPNTVTAAVGDTITFQFQAKNHTATQSTFAAPCSPLANGAKSGFQPVASGATQLPQFTVTVKNATAPMWFYCGQKNPISHCEAGMVFAVNAPSAGNTFAAFQAAAKASGSSGTASGTSTATDSSASATSPSSGSSGTASGAAPAATSTTTTSAGMKVGTGAAGALTAMALLVGLAL